MSAFPRDPGANIAPLSIGSESGGPPALGFLPAIAAGFAQQSMTMNAYGFEAAFRDNEDTTRRLVAEAGYELPALDEGPDGMRLRDIVPAIGPLTGLEDYTGISSLYEYKPYTKFQRASYAADTYMSVDSDESRTQTTLRARAKELLGSRNEIIAKAKAARPDLKIMNYDEMRADVVRQGQEAAAFANTRPSLGANIGGFLGQMAGFFDPRTNALGIASLAAGGVGRTVAMRILSQFGFNAGIEAVEQVTGVRENMQWFGLNPTIADSLIQIGVAGALPAGLQAFGEALIGPTARAALNRPTPPTPYVQRLRRWKVAPGEGIPQYTSPIGPNEIQDYPRLPEYGFPRIPTAEQAVLNQMGLTPMMRPRMGGDLDHAARGADVFGATPNDLLPPTRPYGTAASVIPEPRGWQGPGMDDFAPELPPMWASIGRGHDVTIDEVARLMDPEPFNAIDRLAKQIKETQNQLKAAARVTRELTGAGRFGTPELQAQRADLIAQLRRAKTDASRQKIQKQITELEDAAKPGGKAPTRFQVEPLAKKLADLQAKQREYFPLAERAIAHAQGRWDLANTDRAAFADWYLSQQGVPEAKRPKPPKGERVVELTKGPSHPTEYAEGMADIEHLRDPRAAAEAPRNELAIDTVTRVSEVRAKEAADLYDTWAKSLADILGESEGKVTGATAEIPALPDGTPISELANHKMDVDGEQMSIREFFQRYKVDEEIASDVLACRTAAGFANA